MLESFDLTGTGPFRHAACAAVPRLMVISGPNGVGKSRLLHAIYVQRNSKPAVQFSGSGLYLSPHRVWRKATVSTQQAWGTFLSYWDFLANENSLGFPGAQHGGMRTPETLDEAPGSLKWAFGAREVKRMAAIARAYDQQGSLPAGTIKDIYSPIRELTDYLLPHLEFVGVRSRTDANLIEAVWRKRRGQTSTEIELDDMSSGERAVLTMFGPFLERRIDALLAPYVTGLPNRQVADVTVFIDEPELHLHPILQTHLLGYLRRQIQESRTQFVIVTHSPTLLLGATFGELYVLTPETDDTTRNQLVRLADDAERLALITELCGDRQVVTSCRKILCVEGPVESADAKTRTDASVFTALCPELSEFALVSCRSKGEVLATAESLRASVMGRLAIPDVLALVDRDQDEIADERSWIRTLPVSMMENLLLSPEGIAAFLTPYAKQVGPCTAYDLEEKLRSIARSLKEDEVALRATPTKGMLEAEARAKAIRVVEEILKGGTELDAFRGKEILTRFYQPLQRPLGMSWPTFVTELARTCGDAPRVGPNNSPARALLLGAVGMSQPTAQGS